MSHAQKRRFLGQFTVGWVLIWTALCYINRWGLAAEGTDAAVLAGAFGVYVVLLLPSDLLGWFIDKQVAPRPFLDWLQAWVEGMLIQGLVMVSGGCLLLEAGKSGLGAAALSLLAIMVALVSFQEALAGCIGDSSRSLAYTGGVVGLPGYERVLPEQPGSLVTSRRRLAIASGLRTTGLVTAMAWNLLGFCLCSQFPAAGVTSAAELIHLSCIFSLFGFSGLLMLPRLHQGAVLYLDRQCLTLGFTPDDFERLFESEGRGEWCRPELIETIFHPIPSPEKRLRWLRAQLPSFPLPWHTLRTAMFLSWGCLGWLSRAVHCNCGRPEVWVLLPCD